MAAVHRPASCVLRPELGLFDRVCFSNGGPCVVKGDRRAKNEFKRVAMERDRPEGMVTSVEGGRGSCREEVAARIVCVDG